MATKLVTLTFENSVGTQSTTIPASTIAYVYATGGSVTITYNDKQTNTWRQQAVSDTVNAIQAFQCGLVSIGTPSLCNGQPWSKGEVLINPDYIVSITVPEDGTSVTVQYGSNPQSIFLTDVSAGDIVTAATAQFETPS